MAHRVRLKRKLLTDAGSEARRPSKKGAPVSNRNAHNNHQSPKSTLLCERCLAIDIDHILSLKLRSHPRGHLIAELKGDPQEWQRSHCPLCQFFATMRPHTPNIGAREELVLCAFRQDGRHWVNDDENILLAVVRKSDRKGKGSGQRVSELTKATGLISSIHPPSFKDSLTTMRGRLIEPDLINFDILRQWLRLCYGRHGKECDNHVTHSVTSLKLIDCVTRKVEHAPPRCRYVALSYIWGHQRRGEVELQRDTCLPDNLPRTIEDAITVTKALHLRYLWLDRYCIPQHDKEETHNQIRQMDLIYSGAHVTIIAAAGEDPYFGLPGVSSTHRIPQQVVHLGKHTLCSLMEDAPKVISRSTWMSRAWTFQEALFSTRRLVFTEQQVYYECRATNWSETVDLDRDWSGWNMFVVKSITRFPWDIFQLIEKYSRRELSDENDALNGFLGVFRAFENGKYPVYHYWGVPVLPPVIKSARNGSIKLVSRNSCHGFIIGLCWRTTQPGRRRTRFPSWSWAGWTGGVHYLMSLYRFGATEHDGHALDIAVELSSGKTQDWDAFWQSFRSKPSRSSLPKYLHIEGWTMPLQLEAASCDPTMAGPLDRQECRDSPPHCEESGPFKWLIFFYPTQQTQENGNFNTSVKTSPLIGIILCDFERGPPRADRTFVLVAQEKGDSYECVGHMIFAFRYAVHGEIPVAPRLWSLSAPDKSYPFRHKSIRRIRLG